MYPRACRQKPLYESNLSALYLSLSLPLSYTRTPSLPHFLCHLFRNNPRIVPHGQVWNDQAVVVGPYSITVRIPETPKVRRTSALEAVSLLLPISPTVLLRGTERNKWRTLCICRFRRSQGPQSLFTLRRPSTIEFWLPCFRARNHSSKVIGYLLPCPLQRKQAR